MATLYRFVSCLVTNACINIAAAILRFHAARGAPMMCDSDDESSFRQEAKTEGDFKQTIEEFSCEYDGFCGAVS